MQKKPHPLAPKPVEIALKKKKSHSVQKTLKRQQSFDVGNIV